MRYASAVAASLRGAGIKVRTMKVAVADAKADLYDHVLAGKGIDDLVPIRLNQFRPEGRLANGLLAEIFPPVEWVIKDLMPIGFTVLGGAPKVGKSFIALDAAMNVAMGGEFLHTQRCVKGSVLYLSMDNDAEWRLQLRLRHLQMQYGVSLGDIDIEFHTDFPTGDAAIKAIAEWCADQREDGKQPLMVVADTLAKIEPNFDGSSNRNTMNGGYGQSTANLSKWSELALSQRIGVLATHHIRKGGDEDWMNRFIGSQGIVATATTLMMVDHKRGTKEAQLMVSSRDAGEHELQMVRDGWSWNLIEQARPEHIVTTKGGLRVLPGGQS
jgi:RecA-family ATPase